MGCDVGFGRMSLQAGGGHSRARSTTLEAVLSLGVLMACSVFDVNNS